MPQNCSESLWNNSWSNLVYCFVVIIILLLNSFTYYLHVINKYMTYTDNTASTWMCWELCLWTKSTCKTLLFLFSLHPHGREVAEPWSIIEVLQVKHDRGDFALFIPHTTSLFFFFSQTPRDTITTHRRVTAFISMNPDFSSRHTPEKCAHMTFEIRAKSVQFILGSEHHNLILFMSVSAGRPMKQIIFQRYRQEMYNGSNSKVKHNNLQLRW